MESITKLTHMVKSWLWRAWQLAVIWSYRFHEWYSFQQLWQGHLQCSQVLNFVGQLHLSVCAYTWWLLGHWTKIEEFTKAIEKWSFFQIIIMLLKKFLWWNNQLDCKKYVTLAFKTRNNFRNQSSLHTIRFDGNKSLFKICSFCWWILKHVHCC